MKDPIPTDKEIGKRLREARTNAGLTQAEAAKLLGLHRPAVTEIEQGNRKVTPQEIVAFSEMYAVAYEWILGQWHEEDLPDEMVAMVQKLPPIDRRKLLATLASYGNMY